ncbi:hypothetical protein BJV77DRAFT_952269 [Russula vinacea]|nr:hypothetical protein BJV77DRAFT_952269 [Russula vinacea]
MRTQNTQAKPLAERFANLAQNEVMRITPFTLHITHYSRAHAAWPGRPKIHFEGEMHMQHAGTTVADPTGDSGHRLLKGIVHMAASGDVRWSLLSYRDDGQRRYNIEGVQLGGLGSAMGVISLWASADVEQSGPIIGA